MDKIKSFFEKEFANLHGAAYIIAFASFLSVILALLRDRMLVSFVGANYKLDIYYAAFKIPDLLYALLASFVSAFVLIPFFSYKSEKGQYKFLDEIVSSFLFFALIFTIPLFVFADFVLSKLFYNLYSLSPDEFVFVFRVLLFQFILLGLSSIFSAFLQAKHKFIIYSFAPIIYNLSIIVSILFYPQFALRALALGVLVGAILHMSSFLAFLDLSKLRFKLSVRSYLALVKVAWPRTASLFIAQLSVFFIFYLLAKLKEGAVSAYQLASNLQGAPLSIIASSYSVAAFPSLSKLYSNREYKEFVSKLSLATRHMLFWATAFVLLAIALRAHIVRIVFGAENFSWQDTIFVSAIFSILLASLVFQALNTIFARALYAARVYKPAIVVSFFSFISVFVLSLYFLNNYQNFDFLINIFDLSDFMELKTILIAIAYFASNFVAFLFLSYYLSLQFGEFCASDILKSALQFLFAGFSAFLATKAVLHLSAPFFPLDTFLNLVAQTALASLVFTLVYVLVLRAFSNLELDETWRILKDRWKAR